MSETEQVTIFIMGPAYCEMLFHVLEYACKEKNKPEDVLGLCLGRVEKDRVIVEEAIPIKHGPVVEQEFTEVDRLAMQENIKLKEGQQKVGWYRSHSKMGFYMSGNDQENHCEFQTEAVPKATFLAFDYSKITEEEPLGVKAFRLKDPQKGKKSDFFTVPLEVEAPADFPLYSYTKLAIERLQQNKPLVTERGHHLSEEDEDLFAVFGSDKDEDQLPEHMATLKKVLEEIKEGPDALLIPDFIDKLVEHEDQIHSIAQKADFNNPNIVDLKEALVEGMANVKDWFAAQLTESYEKFQPTFIRTVNLLEESSKDEELQLKRLIFDYIKQLSPFFQNTI